MNDDELITMVRAQRHTVPMTTPVDEIISRGRTVRARRRIPVIAGTLAAVTGTVLGLALTGVFGPVPARSVGTIRTVAFTLTRNANGTDTLTLNPLVLLEPSTLQNDLAQYGIPAIVGTGRFCSSSPAPAGFSKVVSLSMHGPLQDQTITIDPSAMPAGTKLSFGSLVLPTETAVTLIDTNSYTCTNTPPSWPGAQGTRPPSARTPRPRFTGLLFSWSGPVNP
jgi:hypothetical protein